MALARFANAFDGAQIDADDIAAKPDDFDAAFSILDPKMIETLEYAADNIRRYHQAQIPGEMWMKEIRPGVLVGERFTPIDSAALYSPRGRDPSLGHTDDSDPGGCGRREQCGDLDAAGPRRKSRPGNACRGSARRCRSGLQGGWRAGGCGCCLRHGHRSKCVKIEGPGSPWFVAAKRFLQGDIYSRLPAGPSEGLILVDETTDPEMAALDLLIESEHGSDSSCSL